MSRRRTLVLACLLAVHASAQPAVPEFLRAGPSAAPPGPLAAALQRLEPGRLRRHMAFLADPRRDGRGLGTRGLADTVHYLEVELQALGLAPLGPGWRQEVPLRQVFPGQGSVRLRIGGRTFTFRAGRDAVLPATAPGALAGTLVFVGYGIREPALGHDDFVGRDVRGKIVAFLDGTPPGEPWQRPDLVERYAPPRRADRHDHRLALLARLGARAAIVLEPGLQRHLAEGLEPRLPYFLGAVRQAELPPLARVDASGALRSALATGAGASARLAVRGRVTAARGFNVLGRLEGSDPALRGEAILLGAHMDHLGRPRGLLHPGADDNASGVAALLEIARSLAQAPVRPRRTVLVAFWTGEEEGKFGSSHYTRRPRWPLAATRAYLNLDMIGHPWTGAELQALATEAKAPPGYLDGLDPAWFAEPGLAARHRDLGPVLREAGMRTGLSLHLDWTEGRDGGSDYRAFARLGLPFVRFFGSYFPEYHTPGDTLDRVDIAQVQRMASLALATAWLLADR